MPGFPFAVVPLVDVRDVAIAHLRALKVKAAANQRFGLVNKNMWFTELASILKKEFDPQGYSINNS